MRTWLVLFGCAILIAVAVVFTRLHPPSSFKFAAGPEGGSYESIANIYAGILAKDGIQLEIVRTAGSVENARLLAEGKVDAGFLQGGIPVQAGEIEAIGAVFFEPMVFLGRADSIIPRNPAEWKGLHINSGALESGTAAAFRDFENAVGLSRNDNTHLSIGYAEAIGALINDEIDIAVFVAPIDAPYLRRAYDQPEFRFLPIEHVEAISRRLEYASVVTVPTGGMSLDPVLPPGPREFIALEARLVVRQDLHPALINRLTTAAIEVHRKRGMITDPGTFPSVEGTGLKVNNTARQLIQEGPSTWHDWLPYWIAAQVNRVLLLFLPFFFIVVPLLRMLPQAYAYVQRWRVWQHYPEIRQIEEELSGNLGLSELEAMQNRLVELDDHFATLRLPAAYRQGQYDARLHLELVRKRISDMRDARANAGPIKRG